MIRKTIWIVIVAILLASCGGGASEPQARIELADALGGANAAGFAKAIEPRQFAFPADHGPHQEYAVEWWYYTGNLDAADGRHFGYELTFFRIGLAPQLPKRASDWATANIFMANLALTDVAAGKFYAFERFSRGAAGLAGATSEPFRVWLEGWSASSSDPQALPMRLQAAQGDIALDLVLQQGKPVVLQGDHGLSHKSAEPGNASYYYSLTRMPTSGMLTVRGERVPVSGLSWMDREWSTSALSANQVGWDWFALQLDDGRELMVYRLRRSNGIDPASSGTMIAADGTSQPLAIDDVQITALNEWRSPHSGAAYPSGWRLEIPDAAINLTITPYLADQELPVSVVYWEGAVRIAGSAGGRAVRGNGYVELTGYRP